MHRGRPSRGGGVSGDLVGVCKYEIKVGGQKTPFFRVFSRWKSYFWGFLVFREVPVFFDKNGEMGGHEWEISSPNLAKDSLLPNK